MRVAPAVPIRLAAVAVLTAAGVFAAPERAEAGCGDYVSINADHDPAADTGPPSGPVAPCHGPGCSNRPTPPVPPLTAPVTNPAEPDSWATTGTRTLEPDAPPARSRPPVSAARPVHVPRVIFHPPRAV